MRRYVIIIGAMKSGTTTLFDALAKHPVIAPASHKEPGFFAFDDVYAQGFDWFDTLFEFDPAQHRYRLEASTDYTKAPFASGVWERMTADPAVEVKLLYIMRHPLRRLESHAKHPQRHRRELGNNVSPRPDHSLDAGVSPVSLATSAYTHQLAQFEEAWAAGQLLCLTLEDLKSDPDTTMQKVWDFLDLTPPDVDQAVEAKNVAATKPRVSPLWQRLTAFKPLVSITKALLPTRIRSALRDRYRQEIPTIEGRFKLTPEETGALAALYQSDVAELKDRYGIDTARLWKL